MPSHEPLGAPYACQILSPSDIPDILELQQEVMDLLPESQKSFLYPRNAEEIHARLTTLGTIVGIYHHGKTHKTLAAFGCLAFPSEQRPVADLSISPAQSLYPPHKFGTLQYTAVAVAHRGQGLHVALIKAREAHCLSLGRPYLLSQVLTANESSIKGFLKCGHEACLVTINPAHGRKLFLFDKNISSAPPAKPQGPTISRDPEKDFDELTVLFAEGYRGFAMSKTSPGAYVLHLHKPQT